MIMEKNKGHAAKCTAEMHICHKLEVTFSSQIVLEPLADPRGVCYMYSGISWIDSWSSEPSFSPALAPASCKRWWTKTVICIEHPEMTRRTKMSINFKFRENSAVPKPKQNLIAPSFSSAFAAVGLPQNSGRLNFTCIKFWEASVPSAQKKRYEFVFANWFLVCFLSSTLLSCL